MEVTQQRRRALASFLRSRRQRLSPEEAGVMQWNGRRRTKGLRREELATLAGVSITWYTWLEQARRIRVSRQVLNSLSRALQLDAVETEHLFRLAGEIPPSSKPPCTRNEIPNEYMIFLDYLDPLPATITNYRFDVLACNHAFCVLFPHFEDLPADDRNTLLMTFDPRTRALYPDWEDHALHVVGLFRAHNAERLVQPEYAELIEGLEQSSPEFRDLWKRMDLERGAPASRTFDHPVLGHIQLGYVKLRLTGAEATLVVHQPSLDERLLTQFRELVEEHRKSRLGGMPRELPDISTVRLLEPLAASQPIR